MGNGKLPRVASSPLLKAPESQKRDRSSPLQDRSDLTSDPVSEQIQEKKSTFQGKTKESASNPPVNATKFLFSTLLFISVNWDTILIKRENSIVQDAETDENSNAKRIKPNEGEENEIDPVKAEEPKGSGDDSQNKANSKPPEPPKDYIHVRARRGQATDSHSLAERVRITIQLCTWLITCCQFEEKISERMKLLKIFHCKQVEVINIFWRSTIFILLKLKSMPNDCPLLFLWAMFQSSQPLPHPMFPSDSSASAAIFGHQQQPNPPLHSNISNMDPLDTAGLCRNLNTQLPPLDGFTQNAHQYPTFCEDDLQTIVQMGFGQNPSLETFPPQNFQEY
uniref:Uncharacterized protein n=1 Tax=Salix viminalis TaxID=40686 RepID=A0A6N2KHA2_SALVM